MEAASDTPLDVYVAEHILEPLGMEHTAFAIGDEQRADLVPVHLRDEDGAGRATEIDWAPNPDYWAGGHGLYSTPRDYLRFQRMLLHSGTLDGVQILEHETVDAAFSNQIGSSTSRSGSRPPTRARRADFVAGPGYKFGLGLLLNVDDIPGARGAAAARGPASSTPTSGSTRGPASRARSTRRRSRSWNRPSSRCTSDFEKALYASL